MMSKQKVSIILPARNEEMLIKKTLTDLLAYLKTKTYTYEIILVINGSVDRTEEIVQNIQEKNSHILIVESDPGYGPALRKGLEVSKGKYIVIYNVDFYDTHLLDLVDVDLYGKDLIIGSKLAHWAEDQRPPLRKLVSRSFNLVLWLLFGFRGSDTHGIKVMRREVLTKIYPESKTWSGIFDTELVIRTQWAGFKIADFPVKVVEKRASRFPNRLWHTPVDIWSLYKALKMENAQEKQLFYNSIADRWESVINQNETEKRLRVVFDTLFAKVQFKNKKFLEVGCGLGYFSEKAAAAGAQVTGIDIGDKLVKKTQKKIPTGKFLVASADALPFQANSFDLVLCTEVVEHVVNQKKTIDELVRVAKPKGTLVITTPNKNFKFLFDFLSFIKIRPYNGNENWLSFEELENLLLSHKVTIVRKIGFNFFYPHPVFDYFEKFDFLAPLMINMGFVVKKGS